MNQAVTAMDLSAKLYTVSASVPASRLAITSLVLLGCRRTFKMVAS
jgi:hypothetical protein